MLSRVAENLFWMSRYLERAENVARLLDIGLFLELDAAPTIDDGSAPIEIALYILACRDAFHGAHPSAERSAVLQFLTFDRTNPQSILSMIARRAKTPAARRRALMSTPGAKSTACISTSPVRVRKNGFGRARPAFMRRSRSRASCLTV